MALPLETPSRIWRRIEDGEARMGDMPSLPPLPELNDTDDTDSVETMSSPRISIPGQRQDIALDNTIQSNASSNDLTIHLRANASFDPTTGPLGVGRFNAGKLNTYLLGLNRKLQEENRSLIEKSQECHKCKQSDHPDLRHSELSGVLEDDRAEQWMVEKEELERKIQDLQSSVDALSKKLEKEQKDRSRDKERWKDMMAQAEQGVGDIVKSLEKRAIDAEERATALEGSKTKIQELERNAAFAEQEIEELRGRLASTDDVQRIELQERKEEADELKLQIESVTEETKRLLQDMGQLQKDRDTLATEYNAILEEKDILHQNLRQLENEHNQREMQRQHELEEKDIVARKLRQLENEQQRGLEEKDVVVRKLRQLENEQHRGLEEKDVIARKLRQLENEQQRSLEEKDVIARKLRQLESEQQYDLKEKDIITRKLCQLEHEHNRCEMQRQRDLEEKEILARKLKQLENEHNRCEMQRQHDLEEKDLVARRLGQLENEHNRCEIRRQRDSEDKEHLDQRYRVQLQVLEDKLASLTQEQSTKNLLHHSIEALQAKHKQECKGLFLQMRYLKAKFAREAIFRLSMVYQKDYLLKLLSRFVTSEKHISAMIARMGVLGQSKSRRAPLKLRSYVLAVVFVQRAQRESRQWHEQQVDKEVVSEAYQFLTVNRVNKH